jgi:hypothetical protein
MKIFTKRRVIVVLSIAVLVMVLSLVAFFSRFYAIGRWLDEHHAVEAMIRELYEPVPKECEPDTWRTAVGQTEIAFGNIAYDESYISTSELALLKNDVKTLIEQNDPSPALLYLIYNRLGRCNETTAEKSEKWRGLFSEEVERSYKHRTSKPVDY